MKVAILNRLREAYPGGDLVAIDSTIQALGRIGIEASYITDPWDSKTLQAYDVVHVFHVNFGWSRINFGRTIESGKPYVVTPIFYPDLSLGADADTITVWLSLAKRVLPFSRREADEIQQICDISQNISVIPNGTDPMFYHFNQRPDDHRYTVLTVSARAGDKNSGKVEAACSRLSLHYKHASGESRNGLAALYSRSRVFVNASDSERMSLTIGEALCAGCRVLATDQNRGNEWYRRLQTFGPNIPDRDFDKLLIHAYWSDEWDYSPNMDARMITWDSVARQLKSVYEACL